MKKNIEKPPKAYLPTPFLVFFLPELLTIYYFVENVVVKADIMVPWVKSQNSFLPDLKIYSFGPCSARNLMLGQRVLLKFEY